MGHCSVPPSARASTHIRPIYIEDVYLGMCMKHLGIAPTSPPARPCSSPPCPVYRVTSVSQMVSYWTMTREAQADCLP
ncbi:unnamed protein product [Merluccius merluccius]